MYQIGLDEKRPEREQIIKINEKLFDFSSIREEHQFEIQNLQENESIVVKFLCASHFKYRLSTKKLAYTDQSFLRIKQEEQEEQEKEDQEEDQQLISNGLDGNSEQFFPSDSMVIFSNQTVEFFLTWIEENTNASILQSQNEPPPDCKFQEEASSQSDNHIIHLQHNYRDKIVVIAKKYNNNDISSLPNYMEKQDLPYDEQSNFNDLNQNQFDKCDHHNEQKQKYCEKYPQKEEVDSELVSSSSSLTNLTQKLQNFLVISGAEQMKLWCKIDVKQIYRQELVINNFFLSQNSPTYSCLYVQKIMEYQKTFKENSLSIENNLHYLVQKNPYIHPQDSYIIYKDKKQNKHTNNQQNAFKEKRKRHFVIPNNNIRQQKQNINNSKQSQVTKNVYKQNGILIGDNCDFKSLIPIERVRATARVDISPLGSIEGLSYSGDEELKQNNETNLKLSKQEKDIITMHIKNLIDSPSSVISDDNTILFQFDKINKTLKELTSDVWVIKLDTNFDDQITYFIVGKQSNQNYLLMQERQTKVIKEHQIYQTQRIQQQTNQLSSFCQFRNSFASLNSQSSPTIKGVSSSQSSIQSNSAHPCKIGKSCDEQNLLSSDSESVENSLPSPIRNQNSIRQSLSNEDITNVGVNRLSCETNIPTSSSQQLSELNTPTNSKRKSILEKSHFKYNNININTFNNININNNCEISQPNQNVRSSPVLNADRSKECSTFQTIYEIGGEEENSFRDQGQFIRQNQYQFEFPILTHEDEKKRQTLPVYDMSSVRPTHLNLYRSLLPAKDSSDLNCFESEDFRKSQLKQPRSKKEGSITTEQNNIKHIMLSDDSLHFITAAENGLITVWQISNQEKVVFEHHKKSIDPSINILKSMNDNDRFMTGGGDKTIKIYSLKKMQLIHTIDVKRKVIHCIALIPYLDMIAVGGLNISKLGKIYLISQFHFSRILINFMNLPSPYQKIDPFESYKIASLGKITKRRNIKFYSMTNYKYLKKFNIQSSENIISHMEYCQSKYSCLSKNKKNYYYVEEEEERKTKSNITLPYTQPYRDSCLALKTESSDNDLADDTLSVKSMQCKSMSSPKLTKFNQNILACVIQGSYGSRLIFIQIGKKGKMEITLNCEMLTIGIYKVHRFFYSPSLSKIICMPKPTEKKGQNILSFFEIETNSTNKIECIKHTPSFEKPIIDLNMCSDQNIIIVIPTDQYFYLYDVKDQAIIDRSNTLDFYPKQAYVSPLNFAAIHLDSGNGKINIFKLPSQSTS